MSNTTIADTASLPRLGTTDHSSLQKILTSQPRATLVMPCFNERDGIGSTLDQLSEQLTGLESYELIVVDDGSTDGTAQALQEAVRRHPEVRVITHKANRGYGAALKTGIRKARSDLIVITDADGTYPNERIPELVAAVEHADMVVGSRTAADVTYPLIRKIPKVFLKAYASWIARQDIPDINSGLRVFRRDVVNRFLNILPDGFSFTTTITLAMLTNSYVVRYVPIGYSPRIGRSKIKPIRDTLRFFQLILRTGMYFAPLRVYGPVLVMMFVAFIGSLGFDIFVRHDLTEATLLLMVLFLNSTMFALLADMIDKRSS
ncbi:MAG: glycosyltransferase family 2 protein [Steroidobacteraceae bacterium]